MECVLKRDSFRLTDLLISAGWKTVRLLFFSLRPQFSYLYSSDKISCSMRDLFCWLYEVFPSNCIVCFIWSNATNIAKWRSVFCYDRGSREHLQKSKHDV